MTFLAIDPGSTQSAFVEYGKVRVDPWGTNAGAYFEGYGPVSHGIVPNGELLRRLRISVGAHGRSGGWPNVDRIVCEWMAPRGMPTSAQEMETLYFIGRFHEAVIGWAIPFVRLKRITVKMYICGKTSAKDSNVRQALIDRFGGVSGKGAAVGLKATPGPLYGIHADEWQALALAATFSEQS